MKVKELIEKLKKHKPDEEVFVLGRPFLDAGVVMNKYEPVWSLGSTYDEECLLIVQDKRGY